MLVTKSLDHISFEVTEENGEQRVSYRHYDKDGTYIPGMDFLKGDKAAAAKILNQIGKLIGYGDVAKIDGEDN